MGERAGQFNLERHIATGGMAEVYLARRAGALPRDPPVVVKRMLPELAVRPHFVQMFLDEGKLAARLRHPNIVGVLELGREGESCFIAMELVDGPHLGALFAHSLRAGHPLPVELCAYIVARAADGLHFAHDKEDPASGQPLRIVHRDISPQNILVSRAGDVKVTDFGVAKAATQQARTRTGVVKGKVAYMAPEQCLGNAVDRRADIFALGVVLYELLTRKRLFREKSDLVAMQRITIETVPPASDNNASLDGDIDAICAAALARVPDDRMPTAAELATRLDAWIASRGVLTPRAALQEWFATRAPELGVGMAAEPLDSGAEPLDEETVATAGQFSFSAMLPSDAGGATGLTAVLPRRESEQTPSPRADATPGQPLGSDGAATVRSPTAASSRHMNAVPLPPHVERAPESTTARSTRLRSTGPALAAGTLVLVAVALVIAVMVTGRAQPAAQSEAGGRTQDGTTATTTGAAEAKIRMGRVVVDSVPAGVAVLVDDTHVAGRTPLTLEHEAGPVKLQAQWTDQAPQVETIEVYADAEHRVVLLARVPLLVTSAPSRATVRLDGELLGETPLEKAGVVLPGRPVVLSLELAGHAPLTQTVVPEAGKPLVAHVKLNRHRPGARTRAPAIASHGVLNMRSNPWVETVLQSTGENLGDTPLAQVKVPAGRQTLIMKNQEVGIRGGITVTVPEGKALSVTLEWEQHADGWRIKTKNVR